VIETRLECCLNVGPIVRLELIVSKNWISESSSLTNVRRFIVFKRYAEENGSRFGEVKCRAIFAEPDMNGAQARLVCAYFIAVI